jgi:cytoskeleton protein RodZ
MSAQDPDTIATAPAQGTSSRAPRSAGTLLREAREAAGLSLDAAAQQLKLAPRQVAALEADEFAKLPGRTFVRGFVRNYARLVHVDPEVALAALSGSDAPALDSPSLQPTAPTMGELPATERTKPNWTRWAIPLLLIAIIGFAAVYEFTRGFADWPRPLAQRDTTTAVAPAAAPATPAGAGTTERPLMNPIAGGSTTGAAPPADAPATGATTSAAPAASDANTAGGPAPETTAEATLVFSYRRASWTEVKDGGGRVVFSQIVAAGQTRTVTGTPPFDLVIGNANDVSLTFRGQPVDLAAYTSKNVARLILE